MSGKQAFDNANGINEITYLDSIDIQANGLLSSIMFKSFLLH